MRKSFLLWLIINVLFVCEVSAQSDSLQHQLNLAGRYLLKKDSIILAKKNRIAILFDSLCISQKHRNLDETYRFQIRLTKEYESFVYDSAFHYASQSIKSAYRLKKPEKIAESQTNIALILLLKGLFKETIDTLQGVDYLALGKEQRIQFYTVAYRAYYDLSNSRWGYYQPIYRESGHKYCEKIYEEGDPNSFEYRLAKALQSLNAGKNKEAIQHYQNLISDVNLTEHQKAISYCGLGIAWSRFFKNDKAEYYLTKATIADIKSATMETVAAKVLAELMFYDGHIETAYKFINAAQADAGFFGSHARRLEISYIRPQIEAAMLHKVENEKHQLQYIAIGIFIITMLFVGFGIVVNKQNRALRRARKKVLESNTNLKELNEQLREVSRIKEEYVGYYFNFSSKFIEKMEGIKKAISRQLMTKQYDAIETELKKYNSKKERRDLFEDFDRIFLKLFPDFVKQFNLLFDAENQMNLKDYQSLNTDLRIFALIRLGVNDNEKIASILNFSVNTIYTYKTKIKNRSLVPNDEFEPKIMAIKSV